MKSSALLLGLVVASLGVPGCGAQVTPLLVGLDDREVRVGSLLEQVVRATVPGMISLEKPHPQGITLVALAGETATVIMRWIPLASDVGTVPLTFVLDAGGGKISESMIVTVLPSELGRPQFLGTPYNVLLDLSDAKAREEGVRLPILVKDDDDITISLEMVAEPKLENAELQTSEDGKMGLFTFKPTSEQIARRCSFGTQLRARDPGGLIALAGVFIEVRNGCGAEPGVLINEILFDPPPNADVNRDGKITAQFDREEEFVELVNISSDKIELGGATLSDAVSVRFTFPTPTTLLPRKAAVVFGGGTPMGFPADVKVFSVADIGFGSQGLSLNNTGDTVTLRSSDGAVIDSVAYPAACVQQSCGDANDQSMVRQTELSRTTRFIGHDRAPGAVGRYSPGRRVDGKEF